MAQPHYAPPGKIYMSVSTPSVFREVLVSHQSTSKNDARQIAALRALAAKHGARVEASFYRLG